MNKIHIILTFFGIAALSSCSKDWLSAKRDLNAVMPTSLEDMRAILNNTVAPSMTFDYMGMVQASSDDQVVTEAIFNMGSDKERNVYLWKTTIYTEPEQPVLEWDLSYQQVFNANVVLEGLTGISRNESNRVEWDDVKGGALFFRAKVFFNLAQVFSPAYSPTTSATDPSIPLRFASDPHIPTVRSTVKETYDRVIDDLKESIPLLRVTPATKTDVSRPAAYAMLARCLLSMGEYVQAGLYADSALQLYDTLIDYNSLSAPTDRSYPLAEMNDETILYGSLEQLSIFDGISLSAVNPGLYDKYDKYDLRRTLFFRASGGFRGNYTGNPSRFSGLATDELYLIRAESLARQGRREDALTDLNHLLVHRYISGSFVPYTEASAGDVLMLILRERRKQLLFRGLRWSDLRRLSREPEYAVTLARTVEGVTYELPPGDKRYTFPIPEYIIKLTGIQQNNRN